jgi:hypothetical protein
LALTAALALAALPGLAGSRAPHPVDPVPAGAFQPFSVPATQARSTASIATLDAAFLSAETIDASTTLIDPGDAPDAGPTRRAISNQPEPGRGKVRKPPKRTMHGEATFYHNGTTAMRLPRGTTVIICGDGGCVTRVVNDYGPQSSSRIVDLYVDDFFDICGCPSWSGVTDVTVYVY